MSLNNTPSGDRLHISFFGKRNAGKSSLVNAVTGQSLSIVSDTLGTTTDPVTKTMELLPLGPVVITDTPGYDDAGSLGELRVKKTKQILNKTDIAVLVVDASIGVDDGDVEIIDIFKQKAIPHIIAYNKCDLADGKSNNENEIYVSALNGTNINELKELIGKIIPKGDNKTIISHKLAENDIVILVTPIDDAAPKGRLILPQVQTIRDILDTNAICQLVQTPQLKTALNSLKNAPKLVICDSQVFGIVKDIVPRDIPLTSFSILFANYKGVLKTAVKGAKSLEKLKDGDTVLICEGCTHHRQCNDIGTVKMPGWITKHTGKKLDFEFTSGGDFPEDLTKYSLVVHCGGCMLNEREMMYRQKWAEDNNINYTNYGTLIAYMNGILERSLEILDITLAW